MSVNSSTFIMTKEFIYQQVVLQWRTPILDNGKLGTPEIVNKYVTEIGENRQKYVKTKKEVKQEKVAKVQEKVNNLFKMEVGDKEDL